MKVHTLGLACLLSSALAAPVSEQQTQNTAQIQQAPPSDDFTTFPFPADANAPGAPVFDGPEDDEDFQDDNSEEFGPDMMTMGQTDAMMMTGQTEAFSEMVAQVQQQVQMIEQMMMQFSASTDTNKLMESLVDPLSQIDETLAMGVSRIALPGGLGALLGGAGGGIVAGGKKGGAPLTLVGDLLRVVSNLIENLVTRGPIGELLNGLLGGILGGVGGTVGGILGGGAGGVVGGSGADAQISAILEGILGSVGSVLPGAVGGVLPGVKLP